MPNLAELLESTADGAFAVDMGLEIVYWNEAAQKLLGFGPDEAIGYSCYQLIQGLDESRRQFCKVFCHVAKSVSRREPVANYDIQALTKQGKRQWLSMSIVTYRDGQDEKNTYILHFFRDNTNNKDIKALFNKVLEVARNGNGVQPDSHAVAELGPPFDELTAREKEVMKLLTNGYGTSQIAETLVISSSTVRNHIQNILQKLHVHSRAEAVARVTQVRSIR